MPAALFYKLAMSHSASEQEGRAEPAERKEDIECGKVGEAESGYRREKDLAE